MHVHIGTFGTCVLLEKEPVSIFWVKFFHALAELNTIEIICIVSARIATRDISSSLNGAVPCMQTYLLSKKLT